MEKTIPSDIILRLNEEAENKRKSGVKNIINGTIGMFFDEEKKLAFSKTLSDTISKHNKEEDLVYPSVSGTKDYKNSIIKWFISPYYDLDKSNLKIISTPGGTGALYLSISHASKINSLVLIPKISWPNYISISRSVNAPYLMYENYDDNDKFNLESIKKIIDETDYKSVTILINDPCQNPTGYCLTETDFKNLTDYIVSVKDKKINIIYDLAYFDYSDDDVKINLYKNIDILKEYVDIYLCYSFSKSFSVYGLRIGGLALLSKNEESEDVVKELTILARSSWSTTNHMAMNVIADLVSDDDSFTKMKNNILYNKELLKQRANIFIKEKDEIDLKIYPYSSGFFITIPVYDSLSVIENLKEKGIYLAPISNTEIRVALSCISEKEVHSLAKKIKEAI